MKHALFLFLLALVTACAPIQGDPGPAGPAGADGAPGPAGPAGEDGDDALVAGSRLIPRVVVGADGSQIPKGDLFDTERDEVCTWQSHDGELLCLPAILDANTFNTWVDPACTEPGFVARYTPAGHPEGTSVVRLPDGEVLMRGEEVDALWTDGAGLPCQPLASDGFPPPYFHWTPFDASAFVVGTVEP